MTPEQIHALPEPVRRYIHDLETKCDPSGDIQTIADLREQRDALYLLLIETRAKFEVLRITALPLVGALHSHDTPVSPTNPKPTEDTTCSNQPRKLRFATSISSAASAAAHGDSIAGAPKSPTCAHSSAVSAELTLIQPPFTIFHGSLA
jgi:hypothetical protein